MGDGFSRGPVLGSYTSRLEMAEKRIAELEAALRLSVEWGVASYGRDGGMARALRQWIDDGMVGPPPPEPEWLRDMRETLGKHDK